MAEEAKKPPCKYGEKCYRKNEDHLQNFSHDAKHKDSAEDEGCSKAKRPRLAAGKDEKKKGSDIRRFLVKFDEEEVEEGATASDAAEKKDEQKPGSGKDDCADLEEIKKELEAGLKMRMPPDFYQIWTLAKKLKPDNPTAAFKLGKRLDVELCGAFHVLSGAVAASPQTLALHCRFRLDPPEFQTVLLGPLLHYGYLRDDPKELPSVVCSNTNSSNGWTKLTIMGDNLFAVLHTLVDEAVESDSANRKELEKLKEQLEKAAEEHGYSLMAQSDKVKQRWKKMVAKTIHSAGIVVPVKDDVGYRPLPENNTQMRKMIQSVGETADEDLRSRRMDKIMEIITYVQFANDECDYGMGLELGLDLFCSGVEQLHPQVRQLLSVAYMLLDRGIFGEILDLHLQHRNRDTQQITRGQMK